MYTNTLKTEHVVSMKKGIDITKIEDFVSRSTYYKHGNVNNLEICGNDKSVVQVPSSDVMDILSIWGIENNYSGYFVLTNNTESQPYTYNVDIVKQHFTTKYECNSRDILRELNELERIIVAGRKLANIDQYAGEYWAPTQLLLTAAMCNDADKTVALLKNFRTANIVTQVKSPIFRHIYKLIHPKTTFVKTPVVRELITK